MKSESLPISVPKCFRIIAHRGASAYAPENTLAAFILVEEMGVNEVELDVQLTTDGVIAVCHDRTLARYGHGDRAIEEMSWSELASLDMGSWFSPFVYGGEAMIRLDELLAHFGNRFIYHIELKGRAPGLSEAVHQTIQQNGLMGSCVITSFYYDSLVAMRAVSESIRLGWLVRTIDKSTLEPACDLDLLQLCPFAGTVTEEMVALARTTVPEVRAWGLLGETVLGQSAEVVKLIQRTLTSGCDGATINWPDWLTNR